MKLAGWYSIIVGLLMIGQWAFFLGAGQVPEAHSAPIALSFHLIAEFATAVSLLTSGYGLLKGKAWGVHAFSVAAGMLVYTVIVSPGYFAQQGQWAFVGMFGVLFVLTAISLANVLRSHTTRA